MDRYGHFQFLLVNCNSFLNLMIQVVENSDVVVFSVKPQVGKSTVSCTVAINNKVVLFVLVSFALKI